MRDPESHLLYSALYFAVLKKKAECVRILVRRGAEIITFEEGDSREQRFQQHQVKAFWDLINSDPDVKREIMTALKLKKVRLLLEIKNAVKN